MRRAAAVPGDDVEDAADRSPATAPGQDGGVYVSVVVPHLNDLIGLEACLSRLTTQTFPAHAYEIIVADNGSTCGADAVRKVINGRGVLVDVPEKGAGPARNGGMAAAKGSLLAFTDSDCQPDQHWLAEGVKALSDFDFVGGRMEVLVDDLAHMTSVEAFERVFAFDNEKYVRKKNFTVTANLFAHRKIFEDCGGFKTGVSEDLEWSHRAAAGGYRLGYAAAAIVGHPARRTWPELRRKWERLNFETYGLSAGAPFRRLKWLTRSLLLPPSVIVHAGRAFTSPELFTLGQRLGAVRILAALRLWRFADSLRLAAKAA
jgi:glycosyltransferase involved in cell wall biosynthesis